jgi:hypothetical protein
LVGRGGADAAGDTIADTQTAASVGELCSYPENYGEGQGTLHPDHGIQPSPANPCQQG